MNKFISCYGGKYRRNLLTFPETLKISCLWSVFIIMENISLILLQRFSSSLSPGTTFRLYYSFLTALIHIYHGLWLPLKYLYISTEERIELNTCNSTFYELHLKLLKTFNTKYCFSCGFCKYFFFSLNICLYL